MIYFAITDQTAYQPSHQGQTLALAVATANRQAAPFAGGYVS